MLLQSTLRAVLVLSAALFVFPACGTDAGAPSGGGSGGEIPMDKLPQTYVDVICARMHKCGESFDGITFSSVAACKEFFGMALGEDVDEDLELVKKGIRKYNGAAAQTCVNVVKNAACGTNIFGGDSPDPSCDKVMVGAVADGADCHGDDDCATGFCARKPWDGTSKPCAGICTKRVAVGADCADKKTVCPANVPDCEFDESPCATGSHCDEKTKKCVAGDGPNSGSAKAGESCKTKLCDSSSWCKINSADQTSTCVPPAKEGEACRSSRDSCQPGLACVKGADKNWTCVKRLAEGATCSPIHDLQVRKHPQCAAGLACSPPADVTPLGPKAKEMDKGVCLKVVEAGGVCKGSLVCKGRDLYCKVEAGKAEGVCSPLPKAGEKCADALVMCNLLLRCAHNANPTTKFDGVCKALPKAGEPCMDGKCANNILCGKDDKCHAKPKAGQPCVDSKGGGKRCADRLTCGDDGKCAELCSIAKK